LPLPDAWRRAAIADPHFVLTPIFHDYIEAHVPKDPPVIDVAALAPQAQPRHTIAHHVKRTAYVSVSCLIAVGALCLLSIALMVGVYLAFHRS